MAPVQLSPPYRAKTDEDALFDEEMRAVMAALKPEAITPLPVPAIDLWGRGRRVRRSQTVSLQQLKLLPFPVLATLVMMNLFNEPKGGSLSVKRDAAQQAGEAKRVQLDAMARAEPVLLEADARAKLLAAFMAAELRLIASPVRVGA